MLFAVLVALAPIGLVVVGALAFIAVGIRELMKTAGEWGTSWVEIGQKIWGTILEVWAISKEAFGAIYDIVSAWWQEHLPNLTAAFDAFGGEYDDIHEQILETTERVWDWIIEKVGGFFDGNDSTLNLLGDALDKFATGDWAGGWEIVKEVFADAWSRMAEALKIWWSEWLPKIIRDSVEAVKPYLGQIMSDLGAAMATALWESFKTGFKENWWRFFGPSAAWSFGEFFFDSESSSGSGSGAGYSTDLPGGHDEQHYSGTKSRSSNTTININLPPGSGREQAMRTAREINRMMQLGGALA